MNLAELLKLSLRALRANKMRSLLTMLGVIIGVLAVILLVSIGSGLQKYVTDQISGLGSDIVFVIPGKIGGARTPGGQQTNKLTNNDARRLSAKLKNIAEVGPVAQKITTIKYKNKTNENASVIGVTANYPEIIKNTEIVRGKFFSQSAEKSNSRVAVIGQTVKDTFFPSKNPIGERISIAGAKYLIVGVQGPKGSVFGIDQDNTVLIPIGIAQRQFGINNLNTIYLSAKKSELIPLVKKRANEILLERLSEEDFTLQTQEQTLSTVTNILGALTAALGGIAAISLIVGGIGVMNIMLVSVTERTKEIGLRKALGARRKDILTQFLFEAVILCVTGGIIGIIIGLGISYIISQFFISEVTPWSVLLAFTFSIIVGIIFGMAPAIRASKLSPIEALRYE